MTRHNKSSPNTIEYVQRFLFHFVTVVCVCMCFSNLFFFNLHVCVWIFFREKKGLEKRDVCSCDHLLHIREEAYEMILINMVMSKYENDDDRTKN